jgi:putative ABC transport system permease protein
LETLEIGLVAGRNFSADRAADSKAMIINETLARQVGWEDPLGKTMKMTEVDEKRNFVEVPYTVVGVIRDFHFASLHEKIRGQLLRMSAEEIGFSTSGSTAGDRRDPPLDRKRLAPDGARLSLPQQFP